MTTLHMELPSAFAVEATIGPDGARSFVIEREGTRREYPLGRVEQGAYVTLFAAVARDFGTRAPRNSRAAESPAEALPCRPLLTEALSARIRDGYGDPALLWVPEERLYYCVVTSNDAPDSFPILRSPDLDQWEEAGFVFPAGEKPAWCADGEGVGDLWAPELHRVGNEYLLCFTAREWDRSLAIGLARARRPEGPFVAEPEPLLRGGMIDAHIFVDSGGEMLLFWKEDSNGRWPRLLARLLHDHEWLGEQLFAREYDRRTAALTAALWPWASTLEPMEQFFILQPLIEAAAERYGETRERLQQVATARAALGRDIEAVLQAMRTPIYAQRLSPDLRLEDERHVVMVNDLEWEGHLVEGPWVTEQDGRFYLFYAGNDFSTAEYGIGVAVAPAPLGPYRKMEEPLLKSARDWSGPGHPSVAPGLDGKPQLFHHAFFPGAVGYKAFRALLTARLGFAEDGVTVERPE